MSGRCVSFHMPPVIDWYCLPQTLGDNQFPSGPSEKEDQDLLVYSHGLGRVNGQGDRKVFQAERMRQGLQGPQRLAHLRRNSMAWGGQEGGQIGQTMGPVEKLWFILLMGAVQNHLKGF